MGLLHVQWALNQSQMSPLQKLTLITVASFCDRDHSAEISQVELAKDMNVSERSVRECIKALTADGYILRRQRGGRSDVLTVNMSRGAK